MHPIFSKVLKERENKGIGKYPDLDNSFTEEEKVKEMKKPLHFCSHPWERKEKENKKGEMLNKHQDS